MTSSQELVRFIENQARLSQVAAEDQFLAPYLAFFRERYGDKLAAVIFYGSCLSEATRSPSSTPDFFVVTVDGHIRAHSFLTRLLHGVLPPASQSGLLPGAPPRFFKYVYLDLVQLERLCSEAAKDLFAMGRLSKRVALVYARDQETDQRVCRALAAAVASLVPIVLAKLPPRFTLDAYVHAAVGISYQSEYRIEVPGKIEALLRAFPDYYRALHRLALHVASANGLVSCLDDQRYESLLDPVQRAAGEARLRRSRRRAVARWPKVLLTMKGWGEAVISKLSRRDPTFVIPARHRRHVFVFALPYLIRLMCKGYIGRSGETVAQMESSLNDGQLAAEGVVDGDRQRRSGATGTLGAAGPEEPL